MVHVSRTFTVDKPADHVVSYLKDFGHAVDWDPGTQSCERQDGGPVQVGSSWHNVSKFLGHPTVLAYRLDRLEPGHIVFVGSNKTATSTDDITVRDTAPGRSEITYQADVQLHGVARIGALIVKAALGRLGDRTVTSIQEAVADSRG